MVSIRETLGTVGMSLQHAQKCDTFDSDTLLWFLRFSDEQIARTKSLDLQRYLAQFEVTSGEYIGYLFRLLKPENSLGRAEGAEIVIGDKSISTMHCSLSAIESGIVVRDLGSTNGTFINGVNIDKASPALMRIGDELKVGDVEISLRLRLKEKYRTQNITKALGPKTFSETQQLNFKGLKRKGPRRQGVDLESVALEAPREGILSRFLKL